MTEYLTSNTRDCARAYSPASVDRAMLSTITVSRHPCPTQDRCMTVLPHSRIMATSMWHAQDIGRPERIPERAKRPVQTSQPHLRVDDMGVPAASMSLPVLRPTPACDLDARRKAARAGRSRMCLLQETRFMGRMFSRRSAPLHCQFFLSPFSVTRTVLLVLDRRFRRRRRDGQTRLERISEPAGGCFCQITLCSVA